MDELRAHDRDQHSPPFIVKPTSAHTHTLILLHGFSSNGAKFGRELLQHGLCSDGRNLQDLLPGAKFIFPTATWRRSSGDGNPVSRLWFDVTSLEDHEQNDHTQNKGTDESSREIRRLIRKEEKRIPSENILLGGLSQGMAVAVIALLTLDHPLGGFVGMSGWMPYRKDIQREVEGGTTRNAFPENPPERLGNPVQVAKEPMDRVAQFIHTLVTTEPVLDPNGEIPLGRNALSTPVFLGHGRRDVTMKPKFGEHARDTLRQVGFDVSWKVYDEGH